MSAQQKIVFAACIVAALVAMVSCQGVDMNKCQQEAQKLMTQYVQDFQKMIVESSQSMASSSGQNLNLESLNQDMSELSQSYMAFTNVQDGLDASTVMTNTTNILRKQMSMLMKYVNVDMSISSIREFATLQTKIVQNNVKLMGALASVCTPRTI